MTYNINELKESSDFLDVLLDSLTSAIFILDPDLRVRNFNHTYSEIFRKTEERILGKLVGNAIGCEFTENDTRQCGTMYHCINCDLRHSLLKCFLENVPVNKGLLKRKFMIDGELMHKYLSYTTRLITFQGQKKVLVIVDDITELAQQRISLEEQNNKLTELNNQKNKFLSIAAHDLRNPISSIQSLAEIIRDSYAEMEKAELESMLEIIGDVSGFSLKLINDLLDISKIEAGRLELKLKSQNYLNFLKSRLKFYKAYAKAHQMKVDMVFGENIPEFEFDDNKIEQVINNLINNAIKYSLSGAFIKIAVSRKDDFVLTTIEDTGQGIHEDELPAIFNEFQMTSNQPTNGEKSTGLGLAIVKKIVEEHGGAVWATSRRNIGSTFCFTLPTKNNKHISAMLA